ncbi:hypothetical protein BJX68DRAFT_72590 [Aspergillus pseudodeflectus]|uniref:Secreted protein n=1 Tax=Aspergillus pseudodeflectus TaxID=176178 RepID=A0ABR4KHN8_9EURO
MMKYCVILQSLRLGGALGGVVVWSNHGNPSALPLGSDDHQKGLLFILSPISFWHGFGELLPCYPIYLIEKRHLSARPLNVACLYRTMPEQIRRPNHVESSR